MRLSLTGGAIQVGVIQTNDTNLLREFFGNSGSVIIDSRNDITVTNFINSSSASGNAGNINLLANNAISLTNGASINSNTFGTGNGGDINVQAKSVSLTNGAELNSDTVGKGNGGNVTIRASNFVELTGISTEGESPQLGTFVNPINTFVEPLASNGIGGNLMIETSRLTIKDGAQVQAGTFGVGKGGNLIVNASELIEVIGTDGNEQPSGLFTATLGFGLSDAGDLTINTKNLIVGDGGQISTSTFSVDEGNGGNLTIIASESVEVRGRSANGEFASSILAETGRLLSLVNDDAIADGGNLSIETQDLRVLNGAEISAQTLGAGEAGNLVINASESVQLTSGLLRNRTQGSGNAGNIEITTKRLNIQGDDAEVSASTVEGSGRGGDLFVTASNSIHLSEGSLGTVSISGGDSGNITIQTNKLLVRDGGSISNGVFGTGRVGNLEIIAADSVRVTGGTFISGSDANDLIGSNVFEPNEEIFVASIITTESGTLPENPAGELSIHTGRLIVSDGAEVTTRTFGDNPGGTLNIKASELVEISGFTNTDNFSNLSARTSNNGNAGDVTIETQQLIVRDLAQISADTTGAGKAGTLIIFADDSVQLTGKGGLLVQAIEGSTAGNLKLETGELTIADAGFISVSSLEGQAGNLNIKANSLFQNQGQITAETGVSVEDVGANINLQISDLWILENESKISATAFGIADGGNINVDTKFIVAFPNQNNDIIANAFKGSGGNINISTEGIFGLEARSSNPPNNTNDIDASSQFGLSGQITITRPDVDPTSGLLELTQEVVDPSKLIAQNVCTQTANSEFVDIGKGGLPKNPEYILAEDTIEVGLVAPVIVSGKAIELITERAEIKPQKTRKPPAQGWIFHENGMVELVAYNPDRTGTRRTVKNHRSCSSTNI